ncbi:MAG TPA: hypothetical protein VMM78_07145 [Thermomicrobiales bacterium]|nr:hypothetical protein [Thermomicrobiales bacterium]
MRRLITAFGMVVVFLVPAAVLAAPGRVTDSDNLKHFVTIRQATAKHHDVSQALADGYVPVSPCDEHHGVGAMGIHYLNPALAMDLVLDPLAPELLLYIPSGNGLRLVAVEYFVADVGQPHPTLFGQAFDGPVAGHEPAMPPELVHYDLQVWLWQANPAGIFAQWNPALRC